MSRLSYDRRLFFGFSPACLDGIIDGEITKVVIDGHHLPADPWKAIIRHVDAGYPEAIKTAKKQGLKVPPMMK